MLHRVGGVVGPQIADFLRVVDQVEELAVRLVEEWLRSYVREKLTVSMRARLFAHAQRLSTAHHDRQGVADAAYRIQNDVPEAQIHPIAFAVALAISTALHVVVGEVAPKNWAIFYPDRLLPVLAPPLVAFTYFFYPVLWALNSAMSVLLHF